MIESKCVKCGAPVDNLDLTNRLCAPCCETCRPEVVKEVKKNYSMWPHDWRGGWLWSKGQWYRAKVYEGTQK